MGDRNEYEVRCLRCDVSFPVGQKKCIHCGGSTSSGSQTRRQPAPIEWDGMPSTESPAEAESSLGPSLQDQDEPEAPQGRFGFLRGGMTLVWIVLAGLYSIMRACAEG